MSGDERPKIQADFEVIRVQTMASNAIRITLEMPEQMIPQMECLRNPRDPGYICMVNLPPRIKANMHKEKQKALEAWESHRDNYDKWVSILKVAMGISKRVKCTPLDAMIVMMELGVLKHA